MFKNITFYSQLPLFAEAEILYVFKAMFTYGVIFSKNPH